MPDIGVEESQAIHGRAVAGDRTLTAELWQRLHEPLRRSLCSRFSGLPAEDVADAVTDVVLSYVERPAQYNPGKSPLDRYLYWAAVGDLKNLIAKRKRGLQFVPLDPVAHERADGNSMQVMDDAEGHLEGRLPAGMTKEAFVQKLRELFPDPRDLEVIRLMSEGERRTERFAAALGCQEQEVTEQRRLVKQAKDRIRLRLKRNGLRSYE